MTCWAERPRTEDKMSNERKQTMPPHCGNCIYHEWDECHSTCTHPCKASHDGLRQEVQDLAEDGGMSAYGIAESLMDDAIADQEWQPYDAVCDNWRGRECRSYPDRGQGRCERRVRAEAKAAFCQLVESMMPNTPKPTGGSTPSESGE